MWGVMLTVAAVMGTAGEATVAAVAGATGVAVEEAGAATTSDPIRLTRHVWRGREGSPVQGMQ